MNRREALKNVALILGGTVINSRAFISCCSSGNAGEKIRMFSQSDIDLLDEIAETIIPATDTPGAKAAGVGRFMAMMVPDCYSSRDVENFRQGLNEIRQTFKTEYRHTFLDAEPAERREFLNNLDSEIDSYNETRNSEDPDHYFRIMKELVLLGYFTSEVGCKQARRYAQTPGRYEACIDYTEGDRAWANP